MFLTARRGNSSPSYGAAAAPSTAEALNASQHEALRNNFPNALHIKSNDGWWQTGQGDEQQTVKYSRLETVQVVTADNSQVEEEEG